MVIGYRLLALGVVLVGCRTTPPSYRSTDLATAREEVYARAEGHFAHALLITPSQGESPEASGSVPLSMRPLIVQECPRTAEPLGDCQAAFGKLVFGPDGLARVDPGAPTVYFLSRTARIREKEQREWWFLWFLPPSDGAPKVRYQGYRVLLGDDDRGQVWEALDKEATVRAFYVSEPVEAQARLAGLQVLPGRRYAVEPDLRSWPGIVVARMMSEEPEPMGPFVYSRQPDGALSTMLCRCMPSQIDAIEREISYRLIPLNAWSDLYPGRPRPANLDLPEEEGRWREILRLPER